jgi:hypothetical protein
VVAACATQKRGEVTLAITTDLTAGVDFDRLQINVEAPRGKDSFLFKEFGQRGQPLSFPATFVLVGNDDPSTTVHLRVVTGLINGGDPAALPALDKSPVGLPLHSREATFQIPASGTKMLRIHLDWLCKGKVSLQRDGYAEGSCPEGQTCQAGECISWNVASASLPDYDERAIFGGGTAAGEGDCFDVACFAGAQAVEPDAACSIPRPAGDFGVAFVPQPADGGVCFTDADKDKTRRCVVPLDRDPLWGFTERADGRVQLPPKICQRRAPPNATVGAVLVSARCPIKTPSLPTCGTWSAIRSKG